MDQKMNYTRELYMLQTKLNVLNKKKKMISSQISTTEKALVELHKTDEAKVFKIIGNILVKKDVDIVINELDEKKALMASELKKVETELDTNLEKFKRLGAKLNPNQTVPSNDYTLDDDRSIFDISKFNNDTDN